MPAPRNSKHSLDAVMWKSRTSGRYGPARRYSRDAAVSKHRGFSHSVNHPRVMEHMTAHVVAAELSDFITDHLRLSRRLLINVAPEGASDVLFLEEITPYFCRDTIARLNGRQEVNEFLNARLELCVQLMNLIFSGNEGRQHQLLCPRVLKLKQNLMMPVRESAYKNALEKLRYILVRKVRFLAFHLVGFYSPLLKTDDHWETMLQYDGFLTTVSLFCQFDVYSPTGLSARRAGSAWSQTGKHNSCVPPSFDYSISSEDYWHDMLGFGTILARVVAYTSSSGHSFDAHAMRCLLTAIFNGRGRNKEVPFPIINELLENRSLKNEEPRAFSWLLSVETPKFQSYLAEFEASTMSAVEVLAHRTLYSMVQGGGLNIQTCLVTGSLLRTLGEKVFSLWKTCPRSTLTARTTLIFTVKTEEGLCPCGDAMMLHAWLLWAVARSKTWSAELDEWTSHIFVPSVFSLVEHLLQPDWSRVLAAVTLLRLLTTLAARFPPLATVICEERENTMPALIKCFLGCNGLKLMAMKLAAIIYNTEHNHSSGTGLGADPSKCILKDHQWKKQLNLASSSTVFVPEKM